jgi:tetratricopeptide (TPR) repeat protein
MAAAGVGLVALGISSALLWQLWEERRRTARANDVFGESFRLQTLADGLTISGMEHWTRTARTTEEQQKLNTFYGQAAAFYERLAREPAVAPRIRALAFRRLGFTRMVSGILRGTAADDYRRSIAIYQKLLAVEPRDAELRDGLADAQYNLGLVLLNSTDWASRSNPSSRLANSEPSFRTAIRLQEERATESLDVRLLGHAAASRLAFASSLEKYGRKDDSERERRAVLDFYERVTNPVLASDQAMKVSALWASTLYQSLARTMGEHNWEREQEEALRRGLIFAPDDPYLLLTLARLLMSPADAARSRVLEAVELAMKATETATGQPEYWRVLALAYLHARNWPLAAAAIDESLKLQSKRECKDGQASDQLLMAMLRWHQGLREQARTWYMRALDNMIRSPDDDPDASSYWREATALLKPALQADQLAGEPAP